MDREPPIVIDTPCVMEKDIILPPDSLDDEDGNCKRCGHPFNPHIIIGYGSDFSKGGEMRCPVENCECFATVHFDMKEEQHIPGE